jgi:hypothetical protein
MKAQRLDFHRNTRDTFLREWRKYAESSDIDASEYVAAYELLKHAGWLYRYTGDREDLAPVHGLDSSHRLRLVEGACALTKNLILRDRVTDIYAQEDFDGDDLVRLEGVLIERDGLEVVLQLLSSMSQSLVAQGHDQLVEAHGAAVEMARGIDEALQKKAECLLPALGILRHLPEQFAVKCDPAAEWWFGEYQDAARRVESGEFADSFVAGLQNELSPGKNASDLPALVASVRQYFSEVVARICEVSGQSTVPLPQAASAEDDIGAGESVLTFRLEKLRSIEVRMQCGEEALELSFHDSATGLAPIQLNGCILSARYRNEEVAGHTIPESGTVRIEPTEQIPDRFWIMDDAGERIDRLEFLL